MVSNTVFVDALMIHFKAIILRIFREKSWFGLVTNYKRKYYLGIRIFKNLSPVQTVEVPPGETNIRKLLNNLFIFIRPSSLEVGSAALLSYYVLIFLSS